MERTYVELPSERLPPGTVRKPFSDAVLVAETLYLSGCIGIDPATGRPPADVRDEARCLLGNVAGVLAEAGMMLRDLVQVQIFAPDVAHFAAFNEIYFEFFDDPLPARAFIGSGPLLFGARFELTGIAVRR